LLAGGEVVGGSAKQEAASPWKGGTLLVQHHKEEKGKGVHGRRRVSMSKYEGKWSFHKTLKEEMLIDQEGKEERSRVGGAFCVGHFSC